MKRVFRSHYGFILTALLLSSGPAAAVQPNQPQLVARPQTSESAAVLFVHPRQGSDRASGGEDAPLQTITRALALASAGTTVTLAPGQYSRASGEQFPLRIPAGVTLQGNVADYGDGVIIYGGGAFISTTAGRQNAAAIAADGAVLRGLTLSNDDGHGIWIEQGSATITHCLVWGSQQDGIAVSGDSSPRIRYNRIYQNRGSGISVFGAAAPLLQTNRIEDTGYGITVGDQAAPRLLQNYISGNRSGVVIQGEARPTLRNNRILNNRQDGVVIIAQAQPDMGVQGQPGGNQFDGNGQYAINAQASQRIVAAAGNAISAGSPASATAGRIDFRGVVLNGPEATVVSASRPAPQDQDASVSAPALPALSREASEAVEIPVVAATVSPSATAADSPSSAVTAPLPRVTVAATRQTAAPRPTTPAVPRRNPNLLPVPTARVPVGHVGSRATIRPGASAGARALWAAAPRYRVLVAASSQQARALVQAIAPGAFLTRINGSAMMQAGAYHQLENARQMQQRLTTSGLQAQVQRIQ